MLKGNYWHIAVMAWMLLARYYHIALKTERYMKDKMFCAINTHWF